MRTRSFLFFVLAAAVHAQTICPPTAAFAVCDITFAVPAPADLRAEFRSPAHHTYLIPAFWNGSGMVLRVSPTEPGTWDFRVTSSLEAYNGKLGQFTATPSSSPGFVEAANVHHFRSTATNQPHLWMGDIAPPLDTPQFDRYVETRASQGFNHVRITLLPSRDAFLSAGTPNTTYFADLDHRLLLLNRKGITADLVIAPANNAFTQWFPERAQRELVIRYLVARYGALNITWQGIENFETYDRGRELMQEIATLIDGADGYHHPQSCSAQVTSAPLFDPSGWMKYLTYHSSDRPVGAVEHQIYAAPAINDFRPAAQTSAAFRRQLWRSTMNGQYPESGASDESAAAQMKMWHDFFAGTRHWELEPFFDVEGGSALALEGVEYVIYIENPGPVFVEVEKHSYDVEWLNPATGETVKQKNLKDEAFSGVTPDNTHDWVLHISREGHKSSMAKSYKFESHEILMQEVESNPAKVPFEIAQPALDTLSLSKPAAFAVKLTKETKGTRRMEYLWTGEVSADEQSYRVIGAGPQGVFQIPKNIALRFPAVLHVRLTALNANGKAYALDRNYQLAP